MNPFWQQQIYMNQLHHANLMHQMYWPYPWWKLGRRYR